MLVLFINSKVYKTYVKILKALNKNCCHVTLNVNLKLDKTQTID